MLGAMRRANWVLGLLAACGGGGDDGGGVTLVDAPPAPVSWDYGPGAATVAATDFGLAIGSGLVLRGAGAATITGSGFTTGTDAGTIEVEWTENANTMRLYLYFARAGGRWNVSQVQHWDGAPTPTWVFYTGPLFDSPVGQPFTGDVDLMPDPGQADVSLHFRGLTLTAFGRELTPP